MKFPIKAVGFNNGLFAIEKGRTYEVEASKNLEEGDWKTALARGYQGLKKGEKCLLLEVWDNFHGQWARVKHNGREFDVKPSGLVLETSQLYKRMS